MVACGNEEAVVEIEETTADGEAAHRLDRKACRNAHGDCPYGWHSEEPDARRSRRQKRDYDI